MFSRLVSKQTLLSAIMQIEENPEKAKKEISEIERLLQKYKYTANNKGKK